MSLQGEIFNESGAPPHLLGIFGRKDVGKSTAARMVSTLIPGTSCYAFADPIKHFVQDVFGFSEDQLWGPSSRREEDPIDMISNPFYSQDVLARFMDQGAEHVRNWAHIAKVSEAKALGEVLGWFIGEINRPHMKWTGRRLLQTLGTELGRAKISDHLWIDLAISRLGVIEGAPVAVITDGRFDNEAAAIRRAGGKVILIESFESPGYRSTADAHASEQGISLTQADTRITNDKGRGEEHLREQIKEALFLYGWI